MQLRELLVIGLTAAPVTAPRPAQSYVEAKAQAIDDWERGWVEQLLAAHHGTLSRAARAARMGRSHLRQLARRHPAGVRSGLRARRRVTVARR